MAQQFLHNAILVALCLSTWHHCEVRSYLMLEVCSLQSCKGPFPPPGEFTDHCNSSDDTELRGHCCVNLSSQAVIGIDLSYCNLQNIKTKFHETSDVLKINLTHNPNISFENTSFSGLRKLKMVILDSHIDCPGNWNWFNTTWQAWNKTEEQKHSKRCINQTDTCAMLKQDHNYTCPTHSKCVNNGPGHFSCLCEDDWRGYKCLRKKDGKLEIPILAGVGGATILASGFLWYTQRRHVI